MIFNIQKCSIHDGTEPPAEEQIIQLVKLAGQILKPSGKQCFYTKKNKKEILL